jgi:Saccharopine dehydrogenase NADP binding domain
MARPLVLVLGGTGVFGRRIAANLAKREELDLVIAGRNAAAAAALVRALGVGRAASLAVDLAKAEAVPRLLAAKPVIIVDAAGPFQSRNLALPRRCAERGIHYVDIADARERVCGISALDATARVEHAAIVSGASTVPALTTAIVDELAPKPREVVAIEVGITTGHHAPRGIATASAILGTCGRRIPSLQDDEPLYGWGDLARHDYPAPVGERWLSNVDAPERALWRLRYPALEEVTIRAGLEVSVLHLGLSILSRGVRLGALPSLARFAKPLLRMARGFDWLGTGAGAMYVRVLTRDANARAGSREAVLVSEYGDGPQVAAAPAALVVKKLLRLPGYAPLEQRGAFPCIGILTREEILGELKDYSIRYVAPR